MKQLAVVGLVALALASPFLAGDECGFTKVFPSLWDDYDRVGESIERSNLSTAFDTGMTPYHDIRRWHRSRLRLS